MKFLKSNAIASKLNDCNPYLIAVAYIGVDWKKFIDYNNLEKIIISPTLGSNPNAIEELVSLITWDKVMFLDNLHAKIYIGKNSVIVSSSNLTNNGLSVSDGLEEAATRIIKKSEINEAINYYHELCKLASKKYPTINSKKKKLSELRDIWSAASRNSVISTQQESKNSIFNFEPLTDQDFYIVWYYPASIEYTSNVDHIKHLIDDEMSFHKNDRIKANKWILAWRKTSKDTADKRAKPTWMYIDEVIEYGIDTKKNDNYNKLAISRSDKAKLAPPFELTKEVVNSFNKTISRKKYKLLINNHKSDDFMVKNTHPKFKQLINDIKLSLTAET